MASDAVEIVKEVGKYAALSAATATGLAMVFVPSPATLITVPAGIAVLYATFKVSQAK